MYGRLHSLLTLTGMLFWVVLLVLMPGCGEDETTGPGPSAAFNVMGVVAIDGDALESPAFVMVLVTVGGQPDTDAVVTANGASIAYEGYDPDVPDFGVYLGELSTHPGQALTLSVVTSEGTKIMHATMPGAVNITSPQDTAHFTDNQDIPVTWTQAENAETYIISYYDDDVFPIYQRTLGPGVTSHTIPASSTVVQTYYPNGISIYAMNGQGDVFALPFHHMIGKTGFWGMYITTVDVWVE